MKAYFFVDEIERLKSVKEYIKSNLDKDLRIAALAVLFKVSESTLRSHFLDYYQETIGDFIFKCRMEEAKKLLLAKELSIGEISLSIGFKERTSFTHAFVKYAGETPRDFKVRHWKAENSAKLNILNT